MRDIFISIISVIIAGAFAWAGSYGGPSFAGFPALILIAGTGFLIHWIIFLPSFFSKTEKFYDITGTLAYFVMIGLAVYIASDSSSLSILSKIIAVMVLVWALRLGLFLLIRVFRVGEDKRFSEAKKSFFKFLMFFSLSALWVFLTTANALTLILNNPDINGVIFKIEHIEVIAFVTEGQQGEIITGNNCQVTYLTNTPSGLVEILPNGMHRDVVYDVYGRTVTKIKKNTIYIKNNEKFIKF